MFASLVLATALMVPQEILLVLNKAEDTVSLIDTSTEKTLKTIPTGHGPNEVMVSPKGTWAAISNMGNQRADKTLTILKMPSGEVVRTIDMGEYQRPHGMAWMDDESFVVTTHQPEALHKVNAKTGKIEFSIPCPSRGLHMVVLSPDKKMAYGACAYGNQVVAFDLNKKGLTKRIDCGPRTEGISISPDGKTLAVGNVGDETVTLIDTGKLEVIDTLKGCPAPIRTFFSPDGKKMIVSAAGAKTMVGFETKEWKETKRVLLDELKNEKLGGGRVPMNFAHSADGKSLFVVLVGSNRVMQLKWEDLSLMKVFETGQTPDGIAIWANKS